MLKHMQWSFEVTKNTQSMQGKSKNFHELVASYLSSLAVPKGGLALCRSDSSANSAHPKFLPQGFRRCLDAFHFQSDQLLPQTSRFRPIIIRFLHVKLYSAGGSDLPRHL